MQAVTKEHLPAIREIKGLDYPEFWDSPSFAHNLWGAFEGFSHQEKYKEGGSKLIAAYIEKNNGNKLNPGDEVFSKSSGVQKFAYSTLLSSVLPDPEDQLCQLCEERCSKIFAPYDIFDDSNGASACLSEALAALKNIGGNCATKVIKTWLNGWATSHRMHEDIVLPCVLGCSVGSDSLNHYVNCPHMYAFQNYLFEGCSSDPLICLLYTSDAADE